MTPGVTQEMLGYIPSFLSEDDPRPAREQINANYRHGGGWHACPRFTLASNGNLVYPGDPPLKVLAATKLRDEEIRFYELAWLAIIQPDGSFEVSRID
jgi:hypothetical protein